MKKSSKKFLFVAVGSVISTSILTVSCSSNVAPSDDNGSEITPKSIGSNNNDTPATNKQKNNFTISNYFENLSVKNDKNLKIDKWIKDFYKDLGVDPSKPFSFNRISQTEKIDKDAYIPSSSQKLKDIINVMYLSNSKDEFNNEFAYDIRIKKVDDNKLILSVYIYNPNLKDDNVINQNFNLDFKYINPSKPYEKLIDPLKKATEQLEQLKVIKDDEAIQKAYQDLVSISVQAKSLVEAKNNIATKIDEVLGKLEAAMVELERVRVILTNKNNTASLQIDISDQNNLLSQNIGNETVSFVKQKANDLRNQIENAQKYIESGQSDAKKISELKSLLDTKSKEYQQAIDQMSVNLDNFLNRFLSKVEIINVPSSPSRIFQILPSELKQNQIDVRKDSMLQDAKVVFNITPHNSFGQILLGANVTYGTLNRTVVPEKYNRVFLASNVVNSFFSSKFLRSSYMIVNQKKWPLGNDDLKSVIAKFEPIRKSILEILDETKTPDTTDNRPVKRDRIATFLWALEMANGATKEASLQDTKVNFINKKNSKDFSQLQYLTTVHTDKKTGKTIDYFKELKIFTELSALANDLDNTDENFSFLQFYRDTQLQAFILGWWRDFLRGYYNENTLLTAENRNLIQYILLYKLIDLYQIYVNQFESSRSDLSTLFKMLDQYSLSISEYKLSNNITGAKQGLIDDPTIAPLAFVIRFFRVISNRELDKAIKDAADYKKWLEQVNYETLFSSLKSKPQQLLQYLTTLKNQNQVYILLKNNGSDFGLEFTNFDAVQKWFFNSYLPSELSFDKLNGNDGKTFMSIVSTFYSMLDLNSNSQKSFVKTLKNSTLIKGKTKNKFTKLSSLDEQNKKIWNDIFLS